MLRRPGVQVRAFSALHPFQSVRKLPPGHHCPAFSVRPISTPANSKVHRKAADLGQQIGYLLPNRMVASGSDFEKFQCSLLNRLPEQERGGWRRASLPVLKADAFHAEHTGRSACATDRSGEFTSPFDMKKPEPATRRTRCERCCPGSWGAYIQANVCATREPCWDPARSAFGVRSRSCRFPPLPCTGIKQEPKPGKR